MSHRLSISISIVFSTTVILVGSYAIAHLTDQGRAWTTESARKIDVRKTPRKLPTVDLVDVNGTTISVGDFKKSIQLIDFIYTQCPTTCIGLGLEYRQLQSDLQIAGLDSKVQLISISFDLENDTPKDVANYLARFRAHKGIWNGYIFSSREGMKAILKTLEVTVIPDKAAGFIHNAAIYMVEDGHVIEIFDYQSRERLLKRLKQDLT